MLCFVKAFHFSIEFPVPYAIEATEYSPMCPKGQVRKVSNKKEISQLWTDRVCEIELDDLGNLCGPTAEPQIGQWMSL